jgi:hypothetical protein
MRVIALLQKLLLVVLRVCTLQVWVLLLLLQIRSGIIATSTSVTSACCRCSLLSQPGSMYAKRLQRLLLLPRLLVLPLLPLQLLLLLLLLVMVVGHLCVQQLLSSLQCTCCCCCWCDAAVEVGP